MYTPAEDFLNSNESIQDPTEHETEETEGNESNIPEFLRKTFHMVSDPSTDDWVSWDSTGEGFIVYNEHEFSANLLPRYFRHRNFASFIRQLNSFGFRKRSVRERSYLKHPHFRKGHFDDLINIVKKPPNKEGNNMQLADEMKALRAEVRRLQGRYDEMLQAQRQILFWLAHHTQNPQQRGRTPSTAIPIPDRRGDPSKRPRLQLVEEPWDLRSNDAIQQVLSGSTQSVIDDTGQPFQIPEASFPRLEAVNDDGGWSPIEYVKGQEYPITKSPVLQRGVGGSIPQLCLPASFDSSAFPPLSPSSLLASPSLAPLDGPPVIESDMTIDSAPDSPHSPTNFVDLSSLRSSALGSSGGRNNPPILSGLRGASTDPALQNLLQNLACSLNMQNATNRGLLGFPPTTLEAESPGSPTSSPSSPPVSRSTPPPLHHLNESAISLGNAANAVAAAASSSSASLWPGTQSFQTPQTLSTTCHSSAETSGPSRKTRAAKSKIRVPPIPPPPPPAFKSTPTSPVNPFQWEDNVLSDCQLSRKGVKRSASGGSAHSREPSRSPSNGSPPPQTPEEMPYPPANGTAPPNTWDPSFMPFFLNDFDQNGPLPDPFIEEGYQAPLPPLDTFRNEL